MSAPEISQPRPRGADGRVGSGSAGHGTRPGSAVIALRGIAKVYPMADEEVHALRGVDLTIAQGEYVAVVRRHLFPLFGEEHLRGEQFGE